jgi:hypothetical protein
MDDFVKPPTRAKKDTGAKVSKKGGGWKRKGSVKMTVSKEQGAKKVSWPLIQPSTTFFQFQQLFSILLSHYYKIVTVQKLHIDEVLS